MLNRIVDIYPDFEVERVSRYPQWLGRMGMKIEYLTPIFQIDLVTDTSNALITYTIKDITPLTIEDDDLLPVNSLIKSKLHQKAA